MIVSVHIVSQKNNNTKYKWTQRRYVGIIKIIPHPRGELIIVRELSKCNLSSHVWWPKKAQDSNFSSVCQLDDRQPTSPRNRFTLAVLYISTSNVASPPSWVCNREFPVPKRRRKKRRSEKCVWEENIRGKATTAAKERKYISVERKRRGREREKRFIDFLNVIFMARHFKGFSSSALALLSLTRIHIHTHSSFAHTPEGWWKSGHGKTFFLRSVLARVLQQNDGCENLI